MLESITLKFTEHENLVLPTTGITIFVGPNNSGKSLVLRELETAFANANAIPELKILRDFDIRWPTLEKVNSALERHSPRMPPGSPPENCLVGRVDPNGGFASSTLHKPSLLAIVNAKSDKQWLATNFLRWGLLRLDGRSRFNLTNDQPAGDLLAPAQNVLMNLFQDAHARGKVRALVKDAFGLYFTVDPTQLGQFRIRLSQAEPPADEQSLNAAARDFYRQAVHIKDASDGVQAFTGIVTAVTSEEFHTILIDEPEAFLHPPLARKLGKSLSSLATERGGALIASTHSADFLMGCVQASKDVRVIRLQHSEGKSRGRMVDPQELENLFKSPLMRSSNAVSGLFYDGVVVTESDNDRAFYAEIYHRLLALDSNLPSVLFINAQNKQTIKDIIRPLRKFGVPAAAIPDIDIVKDGGKTWLDWLDAVQIPNALHAGYQDQRNTLKLRFEESGRNMKSDGGVAILGVSDREAAEQLFDVLAQYGVFAVRRGEVENWLPHLGVPGKKTDWSIAMLQRLGSDPTAPEYVHPTDSDVWIFIRGVVGWIRDASRKGTS